VLNFVDAVYRPQRYSATRTTGVLPIREFGFRSGGFSDTFVAGFNEEAAQPFSVYHYALRPDKNLRLVEISPSLVELRFEPVSFPLCGLLTSVHQAIASGRRQLVPAVPCRPGSRA
jgi:hypothetical protein